jgi:DNA-binding winged helix-turn-helix (wHTH) protein/Tol biopolymer transport system component
MSIKGKQLYKFGPFRIDPDQRVLLRENQPVPLQSKAFDVLLALVQNSEKVVLKDDLLKSVWPGTFVEESNLAQNIFVLRKLLGDEIGENRYIVTVPKRGYRFAEKVQIVGDEEEGLIVESHSRSRVIVDQTILTKGQSETMEALLFPQRVSLALPARTQFRSWDNSKIAALFLAAAVLGAALFWFFYHPTGIPRAVRSAQLTHSGRVEPFAGVLTDGPRVFYTERAGAMYRIMQVSEQGGEPVPINTSLENVTLYDIDHRGARFLVSVPGATNAPAPLWIVPAIGGSARRVGEILASDAIWSPDGRTIVYSNDSELYAGGEDGTKSHKLLSAPGAIEFLRWSPDGNHLSFTVRDLRTGVNSLWESGADGSDPHEISFGWPAPIARWGEGESAGVWTPDGKHFIFRSNREGATSLWVVPTVPGGEVRKSSKAPIQFYSTPTHLSEPNVSLDGKKVFLVNHEDRRELMRYDAERKQFIPYLGGAAFRILNFSRDGRWVAYRNDTDGALWRSRIDGTLTLQLTSPPRRVLYSSWSPDGKRIAFAYEGVGGLYVVPFDGGSIEPLAPDNENDGGQPSWSPDGKSILFTRWTATKTGAMHSDIFQLDVETKKIHALSGGENFECPQWSPDGRYVAASDRKTKKLKFFDVATQHWSELADGLPFGWGIRWSSDSKYVFYQHDWAPGQPIFRVRIGDRKIEQVTNSSEILRADVLSYTLTGLSPDNSPVASIIRTNSDVFALEVDLP